MADVAADWSIDRLHPSERGHRMLAFRFATALREAGHPVPRLPRLAPSNPEPTAGQRLWWMATRGNQWLLRRSTDLVPALARMAAAESRLVAAEWWHTSTARRYTGSRAGVTGHSPRLR